MFTWLLGGWRSLGFVVLSTVLIYLSVVLAVRIGERRTLAEMTAYDFAVAVALGSIIGRTSTTPQPSYVRAVAAVVALLASHHLLSVLRTRSSLVARLTDRPAVELIRDGQVSRAGLRRGHLTEADLHMVLREHGISDPAGAKLVVLEARGAFSVLPRPPDDGGDPT